MYTNDAGTPADPKAGTGDGGTAKGDAAGSGGRSPSVEDLKALEQKHRENLEKERAARAADQQRIAQLEARVMAVSAPPADPGLAKVQWLQERAGYDDNARDILDVMTGMTIAQLENAVLTDIVVQGVDRSQVATVQGLVRQSNYKLSVADAVRFARGTAFDSVDAERQKLKDELDKTKKELEAAKTRVPGNATTPALAAVDPNAGSVPASTYNAVLAKGGPEARQLMARTKIARGEPGHLDIDFGA